MPTKLGVGALRALAVVARLTGPGVARAEGPGVARAEGPGVARAEGPGVARAVTTGVSGGRIACTTNAVTGVRTCQGPTSTRVKGFDGQPWT